MNKISLTNFSPNLISDEELLKRFEEMIMANCLISTKNEKIIYRHQHSENFHYIRQELLMRMENKSTKARNKIDEE